MKASTVVWIVIILVILGGGAWYYMSMQAVSAVAPAGGDAAGTVPEGSGQQVGAADQPLPGGAAGVNGSADQGNMGGSATGAMQEPGADGAEGSIVGNNLVLGTDGNETLGAYLIAYNGMTLYTFTKDTDAKSTCYDTCATNWPPYLVGPEDNISNIKAGISGKVGTTIRTDGGIQVTYNGHPLYFYIKDAASGDVKGQNVGGVWFVVKPKE